jgi:drug/metabolite transporter (DMT)-like permease
VPVLFVLIWATGFVAARYAAPHAEPLSFLLVRYAAVVVLMLVLALAARASWPGRRDAVHLAVAGIGIQAGYLGGVWAAVAAGMPAGVAALVVNLQPVLTALVAGGVGLVQGVGLALGFLGVVLTVATGLTTAGVTPVTLGLTVLALLAITLGTLHQKRYVPDFDLRTGQVVQFLASIAVTAPFVLVFESFRLDWTPELFLALGWSVLVLTGGGISLLFLMLRRGAAARVTSWFFLVPGVTALIAWAVFGETLGPLAVAGMALAVLGVALATRPRADPQDAEPRGTTHSHR